MKMPILASTTLLLLLTLPLPAQTSDSSSLDQAFDLYWRAEDSEGATAAVRAILATGADFARIHERLAAGRPYSGEVRTGRVDLVNRTSDRVRHHYRVLVPESYDPARRYPVHFYLHGGVSRPAWRKGGKWWSNYSQFEDPDRISVFPASWDSSMWWHRRQAENLPAILDALKRTYNLDENQAHMTGISDGATGVYFIAFREPTQWASYLPFIGHPAVLANKRTGVDGEMFMRNLHQQAFFVVNGGKDRLYPAARVLPYLDLMIRAGAEVVFRPQLGAGHDTTWWPDEVENIRAFIAARRRDPLPENLTWETESTDRYSRNRWLLITELGPAEGESVLDDFNLLMPPPSLGIEADPESRDGVRVLAVQAGGVAATAGLRKNDVILEVAATPTLTMNALGRVLGDQGGWGAVLEASIERGGERIEMTLRNPTSPPAERVRPAFPRDVSSGRVEVVREGNVFRVRTQGVRRYKLLLSPDDVDFEQPITVMTNGEESWSGRIEPDVATLLTWAARDNDRTMLFGAELDVDV